MFGRIVKRFLIWSGLFGLALMTTACAFRNPKDDLEAKLAGLEPSYSSIATKILDRRCVSCHKPGNARGGVDLSSYPALMASNVIVAGNYLASSLYTEVASGSMPKPESGYPRLSDAETAVIAAWIQGGAPERGTVSLPSTPANPPTTIPPPVVERMDYKTLYAEVLQQHCKECHEMPGAEENIDVTDYRNLIANADWPNLVVPGQPEASEIYKSVKSGRMPRRRTISPELRAEMLMKIEVWIKQGALEEFPAR